MVIYYIEHVNSRPYVYCFCQIFQALCLFLALLLFRTLEYEWQVEVALKPNVLSSEGCNVSFSNPLLSDKSKVYNVQNYTTQQHVGIQNPVLDSYIKRGRIKQVLCTLAQQTSFRRQLVTQGPLNYYVRKQGWVGGSKNCNFLLRYVLKMSFRRQVHQVGRQVGRWFKKAPNDPYVIVEWYR